MQHRNKMQHKANGHCPKSANPTNCASLLTLPSLGLLKEFEKDKGNEAKLAELIELSLSIMIHYQDHEGDKFVDMLNKRLTGY